MDRTVRDSAENFVRPFPRLIFSEESISAEVPEEESLQVELQIQTEDGSVLEGIAVSDTPRIVVEQPRFSGAKVRLFLRLNACGLRAGRKIEGQLCIISNRGETLIPVSAPVTVEKDGRKVPECANLEEFGKLCEKNMRKGFRVFTGPEFSRILNGKNRKYLALYKGLSRNPVTYQHLEEFLVSTGRKEPVVLSLDKQEKAVYRLQESQKDTLYLYRNTWGYVRLEIEVEGSFLQVEKKTVTSDDFIGKVYGLEYIVDREKIGPGKSYGKILIRSVHQTLAFAVEVSCGEEDAIVQVSQKRRTIFRLCRGLLDLKMHHLDYPSWQAQSSALVQKLEEQDPSDAAAQLYDAFLCLSREDVRAAAEKLWPFHAGKSTLKTDEEKGAYLFLAKEADLLPQEKKNILPVLGRYAARNPKSYLLLFLLHEAKKQAGQSALEVLQDMERCYDAGCCSPFLYLEAWTLLEKEEALLRHLSPFLIRVLRFGQACGRLSEGLLLRAAFLAGGYRGDGTVLYRLFSRGYKEHPGKEILEAVVKILIKGDPFRPEWYPWYALAVEKDLRITRLYEYYMETFPGSAEDDLPLSVKMYFAYNPGTLGEKKKALLYASVIRHKEEDRTSYANYETRMRAFAEKALEKGRLDENFCILYEEFFLPSITEDHAENLCDLIFARKLVVHDANIRRVVVVHSALQEEEVYRVTDGVAYPRIYTEDACILFEDQMYRRYATTIPYQASPLFSEKTAAAACLKLGVKDAGLLLYFCGEKAFRMEVHSRTLPLYQQAESESFFTENYRETVRKKLLAYYQENPEEEAVRNALQSLDVEAYGRVDKAVTAELLAGIGRYKEVFSLLNTYGYEEIPVLVLLRVARGMIREMEFAENAGLLSLSAYVYGRGKYEDMMLGYLAEYACGPAEWLCTLWKRARAFQLETGGLEKRILQQCILVRQIPLYAAEILQSFYQRHGNAALLRNMLSCMAMSYFLKGSEMEESVFRLIERMFAEGDDLDTVCALAVLKRDAERQELDSRQEKTAKMLLKRMNDKGLRFEFYRDLPEKLTQAYQIEDKVFLQEQFTPDARVTLHYQLQEAGGERTDWISEPMKNVYMGIFVREFLLFYGETLTYYLSVTEEGAVRKTESYQISLVDMDTAGKTRYRLLNRMLETEAEGLADETDQALSQYLYQEAFVDQLLERM